MRTTKVDAMQYRMYTKQQKQGKKNIKKQGLLLRIALLSWLVFALLVLLLYFLLK